MFSSRNWITILLIFSIFAVGVLFADRTRGGVLFLLIGPGARANGMGEAFVALADDPTATYWNPAGLGRYPLSSQWIEYDSPPGEKIIAIAAEKTGIIEINYRSFDVWAATDSGLFLRKGKKWESGEIYTTAENETMRDIIYRFLDSRTYDSTIVYEKVLPAILRANGFEKTPEGRFPPDTKLKIPFTAFFNSKITALCASKKELYVGTERGLYFRIRGKWEKVIDQKGPREKSINTIACDDRGNLYVGTDEGLFTFKNSRWARFTTADGLPANKIHTIFIGSQREVWVGTEGGPAKQSGDKWENSYKLDPKPEQSWQDFVLATMPFVGTNRIEHAVAEIMARNNALGLAKPQPGTQVEVPYAVAFESAVTAIFIDKDKRIWFGTELGLKSFDGKRWEFYGWSSENIKERISISGWAKQKWQSASEKLIKSLERSLRYYNRTNDFDFSSGVTIEYPKSPVSGKITAIEQAPDGSLLIGTEYGTLTYNKKKDRFKYYFLGGLKDEEIVDLVRQGNDYWYNTGKDIKIYSKGKSGISFMHVKWLPMLADDIYYEFLSGTTFFEGWGTVGGAITYINEGENTWTDEDGTELGTFHSYELAASVCYGTKLSENLNAGLTFKLIYSALAPNVSVGLEQQQGVASTFAVDGGLIYDTPVRGLSAGVAVQNIGPNIHYIDYAQADPLPRNLKLGLAWRAINTDYNKLTFAMDINKDLINWGNDPAMKEFREAVKNVGFEYSYANFITLRGGYMIDYDYIPTVSSNIIRYETYNPSHWKGINYFTVGAGLNFRNFAFDFGYIPMQKDEDEGKLVLSNILRYSVSVSF